MSHQKNFKHVTSSLQTHQNKDLSTSVVLVIAVVVFNGVVPVISRPNLAWLAGATLVKVEPSSPQNMLVWKMTFLFHRSDGFKAHPTKHTFRKKYIHWSCRWELVASNWHHISRIHPLSRVYRMWIGQWNWYCRILLQTMIIIIYIQNYHASSDICPEQTRALWVDTA